MLTSTSASPPAIGNRPLAGLNGRAVTALENANANPLHLVRAPRPSGVQTPDVSDWSRLQWRELGAADGFVDGGWWPRSLDLSAELPALLAAFRSAGHEITRVSCRPGAWGPSPGRLFGSGPMIMLERGGGQEPALLSLLDASGATRIDLVVIPPHTERRIAQRVLALARLGGDPRRIAGILDQADRQPLAVPGHAVPDGGRYLAA